MSIEKLRPSFTFTEDRLRELQQVVPEAFADGKINWDTLREALGEQLEEEGEEHFGLFWPGKREARRLASMPSKGSLIPQPGEGVDEENTHNIFIEGENLEVLKLLQKSYAGRIKMIYIDPPYNTGNDFIYPDDFSEPLETYLRVTGQVDEEGRLVTTNNRSAGRYHSNWLNMMFPRLMLAKNLLRFDGNIFISIDDNEFANLKAICDEIFGSECFIGTLVRQTIEGGKQDTKSIQSIHEYLLIYAKNSDFSKLYRKSQVDFEHYDKRDEFYEDRGPYYLKPLENRGLGYIASLDYPIIAPDGSEIYPGGQHGNNGYRWVWSKEKVARALKIGLIEFVV
jgi:adenine-specific DNA-methyltransferase